MTASETQHYTDTSLGQVHYIEYGTGSENASERSPLVCLHPMPYAATFFSNFAPAMAARRPVVTLDLPGYGKSCVRSTPPTIEAYAQAVIDAIANLDQAIPGRPVHLLGYHTGSAIAAEVAIRSPESVAGLVLVTYPFYSPERRAELMNLRGQATPLNEDLDQFDALWSASVVDRPDSVSLEEALGRFAEHIANRNAWFGYHALFSYASEDRLPLVSTPTAIINIDGSLFEPTNEAKKSLRDVVFDDSVLGVTKGVFDSKAYIMADMVEAALQACAGRESGVGQ